jgi:hypothetical protein
MELDSLKQAWKAQPLKDLPGSDEQILSMLQKKSRSPIAKIKRNLYREFLLVVLIYSAAIFYYAVFQNGQFLEIGFVLLLVGALYVVYYYQKNKLLKKMECVTCEVKSNLERQVATLEQYIKVYFYAGVILTPLAYFAAGLIALHKLPALTLESSLMTFFIATGGVLAVLNVFFNRWYVNKLYGQHVQKIRLLLQQMDEVGDNSILEHNDIN